MSWGADWAGVDGNRPPGWAAFQAAGGSFVWIRASYAYYDPGHKAWVLAADPTFARDWQTVPAGVTRGAYMFPVPQASQTPEEQVAAFVVSVNAHGGLTAHKDFPPCLDVEFPQGISGTGLTRPQLLDWIRRAVAALRAAFGCWPFIYTSGRVWNDTDTDCLGDPPAPDLVECPLWLSHYGLRTRLPAVIHPTPTALVVPTPWGDDNYWIHQAQGDALGAPGFTATVDIDRWHYAQLGDTGGHVAWFQAKRGLAADGVFGPATRDEVLRVQAAAGLAQDAVLGPAVFCAVAW